MATIVSKATITPNVRGIAGSHSIQQATPNKLRRTPTRPTAPTQKTPDHPPVPKPAAARRSLTMLRRRSQRHPNSPILLGPLAHRVGYDTINSEAKPKSARSPANPPSSKTINRLGDTALSTSRSNGRNSFRRQTRIHRQQRCPERLPPTSSGASLVPHHQID